MRYSAYLESAQPLDLPPICVRCGKETRHGITLPAESSKARREAAALGCLGVLFPVAHVAQGVAELQKKRVRIPFCRRCRWNYILPAPKVRLPLCGFLLLLGGSLYSLIALQNLGLGFGLIATSLVLLVVVVWKNAGHEAESLPINVSFENGSYRYFVRSGPFVEYFRAYPGANPERLKRDVILRYNQQRPGVIEI